MRVLWVALVMATSLAGCTEVPQVEGWPCVEPDEKKVASKTFTFAEGRPMGNGNDGWWVWELDVADACPAWGPTGVVDLVAKPAALAGCQADRLGFQANLRSITEARDAAYHNGATPRFDAINGTYHYESVLPSVWFGPPGYTEKPPRLQLWAVASHPQVDPDRDTVCLEAVVESVTLTLEYLPLKDFSDA